MQQFLQDIDFSFKYILLAFNFITIITIYLHKRNQKIIKAHHILFVTAHPDDQSMFFRPTIRSLSSQYFIHILVMTCKGTPRQNQMKAACKSLNIHKLQFVDSETIKDGMKEEWDLKEVQEKIIDYITENEIRAVFTFDNYGISGHINHRSIYEALKTIQSKPPEPVQPKKQLPSGYLKIYYLQSVILPRKLSGILQMPIALLKTFCWMNFNVLDGFKMMATHQSQFVWYRKIWVLISRYTYINTYRQSILHTQPKQKTE